MTLKKILEGKLSKNELKFVPSSFDIIGSKEKAVAIIEIPRELSKRKKLIAEALMKKHKNVKTVLNKRSPRKGIYRIRDLELLAGDENTEVVHVESGCRFLIDPKKVYFSPREGTERLRIAKKVRKNENVMIFFAGVGPFAIIIAKKAMPRKVVGIEINPIAVEYFNKNIKLNKIKNCNVIFGDVKEVVKRRKDLHKNFDRVIMPLPESAFNYIEEAILCLKKGGVCHYYCFSSQEKICDEKNRIQNTVKNLGHKVKFIEVKKVLPWGPGIWKFRIDFTVNSMKRIESHQSN